MPDHACPDCGSRDTAKVLWGYITNPLDRDADTLLGGCCVPVAEDGATPEWGCRECGAWFTRSGEVSGHRSPRPGRDTDR